eukprot:g63864.t1
MAQASNVRHLQKILSDSQRCACCIDAEDPGSSVCSVAHRLHTKVQELCKVRGGLPRVYCLYPDQKYNFLGPDANIKDMLRILIQKDSYKEHENDKCPVPATLRDPDTDLVLAVIPKPAWPSNFDECEILTCQDSDLGDKLVPLLLEKFIALPDGEFKTGDVSKHVVSRVTFERALVNVSLHGGPVRSE